MPVAWDVFVVHGCIPSTPSMMSDTVGPKYLPEVRSSWGEGDLNWQMSVAFRNSVLGSHLNDKVTAEGETETLKGEISPFSLFLWP